MGDRYDSIGVPPRQRVYHITRHHHEGWRVWLAVKDMQQPYSLWLGTYLLLRDDGSVTRVTIEPDGMEQIMEIKPRD